MQMFAIVTLCLSAFTPVIIFYYLDMGRNKTSYSLGNTPVVKLDEVIERHFQALRSVEINLTVKGKQVNARVTKAGRNNYTLMHRDGMPVMTISKKSVGWIVTMDYNHSPEDIALTLPFILYIETKLYN